MGDVVGRIAGELAEQVGEDWKSIVGTLELDEDELPDDLEVRILDEGLLFHFASADVMFARVRPDGVAVMRRDDAYMDVQVYRDGRGLESTSRHPVDLAGAIWN